MGSPESSHYSLTDPPRKWSNGCSGTSAWEGSSDGLGEFSAFAPSCQTFGVLGTIGRRVGRPTAGEVLTKTRHRK